MHPSQRPARTGVMRPAGAFPYNMQRPAGGGVMGPASAMSAPMTRPEIAVIPPGALVSVPNAKPHIGMMRSTAPPVSGPLMTVPPTIANVFFDSPTVIDIARTNALESFQMAAELKVTEKEEAKRRNAVAQLERIVKSWVKRVTLQRGLPKDRQESCNAKIFTFGSYQLGVHGPDADIDAICVGPSYVTLEDDFFIVLYSMLKDTPEISEVQCVKSANVPLMRFKFSGISIDLLYARLSLRTIPEDINILDEKLLQNVDDTTVKSLNGCKVTARILQLVPNIENFRSTLRCIKFWAKRRGIYSHSFGFLGGIHWTVLVARVCQMFPYCTVSMLVSRFFWTYANWQWPTPVTLVDTKPDHSDRYHHMPIILPVYPYSCCSYNVTRSTLQKLKSEFSRGWDAILRMETNSRTFPNSGDWNVLFERFPLSSNYEYFIKINVTSSDADDFPSWRGWVESRFRHLLLKLEKLLAYCDPNPYPYFDQNVKEPHCNFLWGLRLRKNTRVDMADLEKKFNVCLSNGYEGRPACDVHLTWLNRFQLPSFVNSKSVELRQHSQLELKQHSEPHRTNESHNYHHRVP